MSIIFQAIFTCERYKNIENFNGLQVVDVDIWDPQIVDKSNVNRNVRILLRRIRTEKPWFFPPDAKIHGETDSELDIVNFENLRTIFIAISPKNEARPFSSHDIKNYIFLGFQKKVINSFIFGIKKKKEYLFISKVGSRQSDHTLFLLNFKW